MTKKMVMAFSTIILLMIVIGASSLITIKHLNEEYETVLDENMEQLNIIADIRRFVPLQAAQMRSYILDDSEKQLDLLRQRFDEVNALLEKLKESKGNGQYTTEIEQVLLAQKEVQAYGNVVINAVQNGEIDVATKTVLVDAFDSNTVLVNIIEGIQVQQYKTIDEVREKAQKQASTGMIMVIGILVLSLILVVVILMIINRIMIKPIIKISDAVQVVSTGDLTEEDISCHSKDEIQLLTDSFNKMKHSLRSVIYDTNENAVQLTASAEELLASTDEVNTQSQAIAQNIDVTAQSINESAISSNESTIAMSETTEGVQRIAGETLNLQQKAIDTKEVAVNGRMTVTDAQNQMQVISQSSEQVRDLINNLTDQIKEISSISNVITGITEQTNLLALNAAIEAARAGEHGKGFAVVADEVRKLAEESKVSAAQIVNLTHEIVNDTSNVQQAVGHSLEKVKDGVSLITEAGEAFNTIQHAIEEITIQVTDISSVTEEISAVSEQVSTSMTQIASNSNNISLVTEDVNQAVQEQTASIEEVNNISKELGERAVNLQQSIQHFRL